jgi:hypothetical protein
MTHPPRRIRPGLRRVRTVLDTLDRNARVEGLRRDVRWAC